jgi:diaminopimelate decarboxylase
MICNIGNELCIGDIHVTTLVEKYGEPAYIYDAEVIQRQYERLRSVLPDQVEVFYSMKANPNLSIVSFIKNYAQGAEICSLHELHVAHNAGVPPERMIFVGPSKSEQELAETIRRQISCLVVESEGELRLVDQIAGALHRKPRIALRVNPAFDAGGSKLKMGGSARQFGVDEEGVEDVLRLAASLTNAKLIGIHVYLGTRILDHEVAWKNTHYVLEMARRLEEAIGLEFELIDFGGGLGVPYFTGEQDFDLSSFGHSLRAFFAANENWVRRKRFILESGRYLTAESGVYVTRVRYVKRSRGQRFVMTSGGMNHHQATTSLGTLIKNHFPIEVLNKLTWPKNEDAQVCGPLCTPGDVLGKSVPMAEVEPGDLIGILKSGAYGLTASPVDFLSHAHPAEVMVYKGQDALIRQRTGVTEALRGQFPIFSPAASENTTVVASSVFASL